MNYVDVIKALIAILLIGFFYFILFYSLFEIKLDWTEAHELLLWYNEYGEGGKVERKFIKLFKRNQR